MTLYGPITYLKRVIGIFIITISISSRLTADDLQSSYLFLGDEFIKSQQYFLAYQNYASAFLLEDDIEKSVEIGLKALSPCLTLNRVLEGSWLIDSLIKIDNKEDYYNTLQSLLYIKGDMLPEADLALTKVVNTGNDRAIFLRSYSSFMREEYNESIIQLHKVSNSFKYKVEVTDLSSMLQSPPAIKYKNPFLSSFISMIIPGGGQFYSGLTFDGISALTTNALFGSTAAVLWIYELDRAPEVRNFSLPVISTAIFGIFYITNIYNAYNSANRFNNYHKNRYYNDIFERFQLILSDNSLFIGYKEEY